MSQEKKPCPPSSGDGASPAASGVTPCSASSNCAGQDSKTKDNRIDIVFDPDKSKKVKKCDKIVHVQFMRYKIDGKVITGAEFSPSYAHKTEAVTSSDGWVIDSLPGETTPDYQQGRGDGKKNGGSITATMVDVPRTAGGTKGFYDPVANPSGIKKLQYEFSTFAYCMKGDDCGKWYDNVQWEYNKTWEDQRDGKIGESKITDKCGTGEPAKGQIEAFEKFNKENGFTPCK
ncbi:MAG TPA: hypothetical protein VF173_23305 [Thermoanaerobaculia bacterium]|nr:hypothetical protein [Thermoanaerobaculia bacterium]